MNKEIPIMFCFDNNYVVPAAVAFYSLLENANSKNYYKLYVLHSDITDENQCKLEDTIKKFSSFSSLKFIDMSHGFDELWKRIKTKGHFSKEVMYKVLVSSIFPQYEKLIVSDVDVVFLNDISKSYVDFDVSEDFYLAGVKAIGKIMHYMDNYKDKFSEDEIKKLSGFCGGYIVFNLKKLREDNMEEKFINCFEKEGYRINQMEQDVLNLCCYPKTKALPLKYVACSYMWDLYKTNEDFANDENYTKEELKDAMNNTVQLHYATSIKPWKNVDCTKSEVWFKYIVKTSFLRDYLIALPGKIAPPRDQKEGIKSDDYQGTLIKRALSYVKKNPLFIIKPAFYMKLYKKIKSRLYTKKPKISLLIIDDLFPSKISSFRYEEFISYMHYFKDSYALLRGNSVLNENNKNDFQLIIDKLVGDNPKLNKRVILDYPLKAKTKLAVLTFLNNAYSNIEFLEQNKINFIFTLYPGGGFALNSKVSDKKIKRVLSSPVFKKVIVTQKVSYDYLIEKQLCEKEKIEFIFGIVTPKKMLERKILNKKYYGFDKERLDICFVAHKYTNKGVDKGYDIFIETAKHLSKKYNNIYFHVVGGFSEEDIDVTEIKEKIKFYGIKDTEWFLNFYVDKDIIISPNKPFILSEGSFDGFPTGSCTEAMVNKVVLFCTDELKLNTNFIDKTDIVLIKPDVKDVVKKVEYYLKNYSKLRDIAENGYLTIVKNYSFDNQIKPRIKMIRKELKVKKG